MNLLQTLKQIWTIYKTPINYHQYIDPVTSETTKETVVDSDGWTLPTRLHLIESVNSVKSSLVGLLVITLVFLLGRYLEISFGLIILILFGIWLYIAHYHASYLRGVYNKAQEINKNTQDGVTQESDPTASAEDTEFVEDFISNIFKDTEEK